MSNHVDKIMNQIYDKFEQTICDVEERMSLVFTELLKETPVEFSTRNVVGSTHIQGNITEVQVYFTAEAAKIDEAYNKVNFYVRVIGKNQYGSQISDLFEPQLLCKTKAKTGIDWEAIFNHPKVISILDWNANHG